MARLPREQDAIREAVALTLACLVAVVWAITQLASVFFGKPVDTQVHLIMLTVVGSLLGGAGISAWRGKNDKNGS